MYSKCGKHNEKMVVDDSNELCSSNFTEFGGR
jgi:hypothetical protein